MIWQQVLATATKSLNDAGIDGAARDARRLLAHVLGLPMDRITLITADDAPQHLVALFEGIIAQRGRRVPVAHLTGNRIFYDRVFEVTPDVLDPRPETEVLIAAALSVPFTRVLDLGTGSGCILLTLLAEHGVGTFGVGTDLSRAALSVAMRNAANLKLGDRVQFFDGDWFDALSPSIAQFDLIVANPPYIALDELTDLAPDVGLYEPRMALTDDADGLTAYRHIIRDAPHWLRHGGHLMVEIGPTQAAAVTGMMKTAGFDHIVTQKDMDGRDRVVFGQNPPQ